MSTRRITAADLRPGMVAEHAAGRWPRPMRVEAAESRRLVPWHEQPTVVVAWSSGERMPLTPDAPFLLHEEDCTCPTDCGCREHASRRAAWGPDALTGVTVICGCVAH